MADLKKVYTAVTEDEALENLMAFKEKWRRQYPSCAKCSIWPAGKLSSTGLSDVEIGTWFWLSFRSCSRIARPPEPGLTIVFPGRGTAFTLRVQTASHPGTQSANLLIYASPRAVGSPGNECCTKSPCHGRGFLLYIDLNSFTRVKIWPLRWRKLLFRQWTIRSSGGKIKLLYWGACALGAASS